MSYWLRATSYWLLARAPCSRFRGGHLGAMLGVSRQFEAILGPFGCHVWSFSGHSWPLGAVMGPFGPSWSIKGPHGRHREAILDRLGAILRPFWDHQEPKQPPRSLSFVSVSGRRQDGTRTSKSRKLEN